MRIQKAHRVTKVSSLAQSTLDQYVRKDDEPSESPLLSGITRGKELFFMKISNRILDK